MAMNKIVTDIVLELDGDSPFKYVMAKQGDEAARVLSITLLENKQEYVIGSGVHAEVRYYKPDAKMVTVNCTIKDNKIIMEYTPQMLVVHGTGKGEIVLLSGTSELKTATFYTNICENVFSVNGLISDHEFQNMAAAVIKADEAAEKTIANANEAKVKADLANTAAANANTAATNANTARNNANIATTNANNAASRADAATIVATTATTEANAAASDANTAKTNANTAANNANAKAALADVAAGKADTQAIRAETIATQVENKLNAGDFVGPQGEKGDTGEPFRIAKTYASIAAMNSGYSGDGVEVGQFVVIDMGNTSHVDNGKIYLKGMTQYNFIVDLSGVDGIQGPEGQRGLQGIQGPQGDPGDTGPMGEVNPDATLSFAQAETRVNVSSGEKLGTTLGKVMKWFADIKSHAFETLVDNLTTSIKGKGLDSSQGKVLKDLIDATNTNLSKTVKIFDHEALRTKFDFNDPNTPAGIHRLADTSTFTNAPSGVDVGWVNVLVIRVPGGVLSMQIFLFRSNSIYLRSGTIENWTSKGWDKVVTEQGANTFTGRQIMKGSVGVNANSWSDSRLLIQAPYNENRHVRAGLAFDNTGNNAAYLYFDITGQLKLVDNAGGLFEIQMTKLN